MYRTLKIESYEDLVVRRDQSKRQAGRSRSEATQLVYPALHRSLPQDDSIESVPGHQGPTRLETDIHRRGLIDDVEHPAPVGHRRAEAGGLLMSARELGVSDPLDVAGRTYKLVPGDRVIVRAMQEMGPVIDLCLLYTSPSPRDRG